jgi:hypothetical protein
MRNTAVSILIFLVSFLSHSNVFADDFDANIFQFDSNICSLSNEKTQLRLGVEEDKKNIDLQYSFFSFTGKVKFEYVGKNEVNEKVFFDESGSLLFAHYEKQADPFQNRNLQHFLSSQERTGVNFQILYPFVPYFHIGDKNRSCKMAQLGKNTLMQCEWRFW